MSGLRPVARVIRSQRFAEGAGFVVRRPFPLPGLEQLDPFLLLDEMGPVVYAPGEAIGAPDHPHRGFETVTYLLDGAVEHRDSTGAVGVIERGDVQWMTAGAGIVHSEMPTPDIRRDGGRVHGFQLWVNLRAAEKMTRPKYQGFAADELPIVPLPSGGSVRVIAGEVAGTRGPVVTTSPATYAHVVLEPGDELGWEPPAELTVLVYVFDGSLELNERSVADGELVAFEHLAGAVELRAAAGRVQALLLAGTPLGEPIFRYGPFVMNTKAEIIEAFDDFEAGRLGSIPATGSGVLRP